MSLPRQLQYLVAWARIYGVRLHVGTYRSRPAVVGPSGAIFAGPGPDELTRKKMVGLLDEHQFAMTNTEECANALYTIDAIRGYDIARDLRGNVTEVGLK